MPPGQQSSAPSQPSNEPQPSRSVNQQGVWDTVPQYRLTKDAAERYLTKIFGYKQFHTEVKITLEAYRVYGLTICSAFLTTGGS